MGSIINRLSSWVIAGLIVWGLAFATAQEVRVIPPVPSSINPQGRLSLTSGSPVTGTVSGATTIYYGPYSGPSNYVPFYNGTSWYSLPCGEISNITTNSATGNAGPAAVAATSYYDLVAWDNGGTCVLTRMAAWTNATTRSATLTRTNGIWLNTAAVTNGPAALRGTYVGMIGSNGSSTVDYIFGGSATAGVFNVWNMFNRVTVTSTAFESTATWAYSSATVRAINVGSNLSRISFVSGQPEEGIFATSLSRVSLGGNLSSFSQSGFALGSTTAFDKYGLAVNPVAGVALQLSITISNTYAPQTGFNYIQQLEAGDGTNSNTFYGTPFQGMTVVLKQ